ncbi:MAG: MBL fold metallo-hydrolase, partial [Victivallaceae bacterium]
YCLCAGLTAVLFGLLLIGCVGRNMGKLPTEVEYERFAKLDNFSDGKFQNNELVTMPNVQNDKKHGRFNMMRFLFGSENAPQGEIPLCKLTRESFGSPAEDFAFYWLGHASMIFELDGKRILIDPVFGNAAPIPWAVERYTPPPLDLDELPEVDLILLTHDHYDHLEYDFIDFVKERKVEFVVPLGVGARLRGWGVDAEQITEVNWEDEVTFDSITITSVISRHFSGRTLNDRNTTLWNNFIIAGKSKKIFFGSDGGYGEHFKRLGEKYGPFDLVCLEIDAWNERWPYSHLFPDQVKLVFKEL